MTTRRLVDWLIDYVKSWWVFLAHEWGGFYRPPVVLPAAPPVPDGHDRDRDEKRQQSERMRRLTRMYLDYELGTLRRIDREKQ